MWRRWTRSVSIRRLEPVCATAPVQHGQVVGAFEQLARTDDRAGGVQPVDLPEPSIHRESEADCDNHHSKRVQVQTRTIDPHSRLGVHGSSITRAPAPLASVRGHDAIGQLVAAAQAQFRGLQFTLSGPIDAHHDHARFAWHFGAPGSGDPLVIGFDVALMNDGRLQEVYGFLDKIPSAAALAESIGG
jgi:hypothetical protein